VGHFVPLGPRWGFGFFCSAAQIEDQLAGRRFDDFVWKHGTIDHLLSIAIAQQVSAASRSPKIHASEITQKPIPISGRIAIFAGIKPSLTRLNPMAERVDGFLVSNGRG
jgi:hypothetical protein